jgi:hypothetical protein
MFRREFPLSSTWSLSSVHDHGDSEFPARSVAQNSSKVLCADDAEHNHLRSSGAL